MERRIKTVCTIGPTSETPEVLEKLVAAGLDVARINFSHATYDEFLNRRKLILEFNKKYNRNVQILADLQGPRMRVGVMPEEGLTLADGDQIWFSVNDKHPGTIFINDPYLHQDIQVDHPIFLSSGEMELVVTEKDHEKFKAVVVHGGILYSRKGVNVPNTTLTTKGLTKKDLQDAEFVVKNGADMVAMSFVCDKEDIFSLREIVGSDIKIVPKIERKQALPKLDEIIEVSDVIMVARGDLGVELPPEELPMVQKDMIARTKKLGKQSIVATQMLLSMVNHPYPTRAEISDAANAIFDGADMLMLSDETAFGKYPVQALNYLVRTIEAVERHNASLAENITSGRSYR